MSTVTFNSPNSNFLEEVDSIFYSLIGVSVLIGTFSNWKYQKRCGKAVFDMGTICTWIIFVACALGNVVFLMLMSFLLHILINKYDPSVYADHIKIYLYISFSGNCVGILRHLYAQTEVRTFFIDWEKPRKNFPVPAWRKNFLINEWNELISTRRTSLTFRVVATFLIIQWICFTPQSTNFKTTYNMTAGCLNMAKANPHPVPGLTIMALLFAAIGMVQLIISFFITERFFSHPVLSYIDLCSVSNVSVLVMKNSFYGYYIHGKSVHGNSDTDMQGLVQQFENEHKDLVSRRGLVTNSDLQTFEVVFNQKARQQINEVYDRQNLSGTTDKSKAYELGDQLNHVFIQFFCHALRGADYVIQKKTLPEILFDYEVTENMNISTLYQDPRLNFTSSILYGNCIQFLAFETITISFLMYVGAGFELSLISLFAISEGFVKIFAAIGSQNLVTKTFVDKRFLI